MSQITRRDFLSAAIRGLGPLWVGHQLLGATRGAQAFAPATLQPPPKRPNVLFLVVDDLRPELGCYGSPLARTPHIDQLAAEGVIFQRAYCQQAICGPSRISVLSGYRPDTLGIYTNQDLLRDIMPDALTLPQHLRRNGYSTVSISKVYHDGDDDPEAWTQQIRPGGAWSLYPQFVMEAPDVADDVYRDGQIAEAAIQQIRKRRDETWFLAVGFNRPHTPLAAPKRYWDLYDPDEIALPHGAPPVGAAPYALAEDGALRGYEDIPDEGPFDDNLVRRLIHGYHACTSFVDEQIGRILQALDKFGLREQTIVVLWGDNGIKLGEFGYWNKHSVFELDAKTPLIISAPGFAHGKSCYANVELLDLYPTLAALCRLDIPAHCEGKSLVPLLEQPLGQERGTAYSQYPRLAEHVMGYSVRTGRWRYNEWRNMASGEVLERELYDHKDGPLPSANLADAPENGALVRALSGSLVHGFPKTAEYATFLPASGGSPLQRLHLPVIGQSTYMGGNP